MTYRNDALLRLCRGRSCYVRIPGVCTGDPETTVPAHSNAARHGKGGALKAHDLFAAPACAACHYELDQGKRLSHSERQLHWTWAWEQWLLTIFEEGLVVVAGTKQRQPVYQRPSKILPRRA